MPNILEWAALYSLVLLHKGDWSSAVSPLTAQSVSGRVVVVFPTQSFQAPPMITWLSISARSAPSASIRLHASWISQSNLLLGGEEFWLELPAAFRASTTGTYNTALLVKSDYDVMVTSWHSFTAQETTPVLVLPPRWAATFFLFPSHTVRFFAVMALQGGTVVTVHARGASPPASRTERLNIFEVFFSAETNFQPHLLTATHPVLVYAGFNALAPLSPSTKLPSSDKFFNDYVLPLEWWSQTYVSVAVEGSLLVTSSSPVNVTFSQCDSSPPPQDTTVSLETAQSTMVPVQENCPVHVAATGPVHVLQSFAQGDVVFNVLAVEQFLPTYTIIKGKTQPPTSITIIIKQAQLSGLRFLGETTTYSSHSSVYTVLDYGVYTMSVQQGGRVTVFHVQGEKFGLYAESTSTRGLKAWLKGGMGLVTGTWGCVTGLLAPTPGDQVDNDCDNRVDEELTEQTDADRDGLRGEDLAVAGAVPGGWGQWRAWQCSHDCDVTEVRRRTRACDSPRPSLNGSWCLGASFELGGHCIGLDHPCLLTCPNGTWGSNCSQPCPANCLLGTCLSSDGRCEHNSCSPGYRGRFCDVPCARNTYGPGCYRLCSQRCIYIDCNPVTGKCGDDGMAVRWYMLMVPAYIFIPTAVIVFLRKFGKGRSRSELLGELQWGTANLVNAHARLQFIRRKHGGPGEQGARANIVNIDPISVMTSTLHQINDHVTQSANPKTPTAAAKAESETSFADLFKAAQECQSVSGTSTRDNP